MKEKVWKKLQGWKMGFFSYSGKEVLIKGMVQAIPTYTMSIFKVPFTLCHERESLIGRFWWGCNDGKTKMLWLIWEKLSKFKEVGGLGFRVLTEFNQSPS